jgi:hypothetical protein
MILSVEKTGFQLNSSISNSLKFHRVKSDEVELDSMRELIVWTYDWVPEGPRGFVRDIRLRWACEEAVFGYSVRTVPFNDRGAGHLAR